MRYKKTQQSTHKRTFKWVVTAILVGMLSCSLGTFYSQDNEQPSNIIIVSGSLG